MGGISAAQSISGVLAKVKAVGKDSKNQQQGFNYRGIDAVVNAVNPVLAEVGGFIVGQALTTDYEPFTTAAGKAATSVRLTAKYLWYGTDGGEPIVGVVSSEANDLADKATAKAWSVALRTFLLQTLMLPTDERDPDADYESRGSVKDSITRAEATLKLAEATPKRADEPAPISLVLANEWLEAINGADTVAQLQAAWEGAGKAGVTRDPRIVKAKDDRKAALANA